jgi:hypothetical protein
MKQRIKLTIIFASLSIILFCSCLSTAVTEYSTDATVTAFSIRNDSVPAMAKTTFSIDAVAHVIYNVDSLPFHCKTLKAFPTVTATSSSGFLFNDTVYKSSDSIDFVRPQKLTNVAEDGTTRIDYAISVRKHTVDPDSIVWKHRVYPAVPGTITDEKAVYYKAMGRILVNTGSSITVYSSIDGKSWDSGIATDLPSSTKLSPLTLFQDSLFLINSDGQHVLKSGDGIHWKAAQISGTANLYNLIGVINQTLWAITYNGGTSYTFAKSLDGIKWTTGDALPSDFPVSDFTSVSFLPPAGQSKIVVIGGYNAQNAIVNSVYTYTELSDPWVRMDGKTKGEVDLRPRAGSSVVWYNNQLMMLGGKTTTALLPDTMLWSKTEGQIWTKGDSLTLIPKSLLYAPRMHQSVFVDQYYRIWIAGGQDLNGVYNRDLWVGRLNKLGFPFGSLD